MSQLTINPLASSPIAASPAGLVRASNVVTITLTDLGQAGFAVGNVAVVSGSTSVLLTTFNIAGIIQSVGSGGATITINQTAPNDTGGGGIVIALPAFYDLPDSQLAANQPWTGAKAIAISHNVKFSAVESEKFTLGYFTSGNVLPVPVSQVDGYVYSVAECQWELQFASSRQPGVGFVPGQLTFPVLANNDVGKGTLVTCPDILDVNTSSGVPVLWCQVYFNGSGVANQGLVLVTCTATRAQQSTVEV